MPDLPEQVAIVGMAGRFPGVRDIETLWARLCAGEECLTRFSAEELRAGGVPESLVHDPRYVPVNGELPDADLFDADFFSMSAREAAITDPQQRILLEIAWHAMEDAGFDLARSPAVVGVFAGCGSSSYLLRYLLPNRADLADVGELRVKMGNGQEYLATRIAWKLNLTGPSLNINTACSTSLVAVHAASDSLLSHQCDVALAGGISVQFPQKTGYLYTEGGILSRDGHCRAFDEKANGTVNGNGGALVVLKRLRDAAAEGDRIYAVIRASAVNNDGSDKAGFTAPSVAGQSRVIEEALELSGVSADNVGYIETHGTGTPVGDPIEFAALCAAFRARTNRKQFCAIGSIKTNLGHLDEAAGVTGLIKAALSLYHRQIPPSLHFTAPNPELGYESSPFYVNQSWQSWDSPREGSRAAAVSSFGIGGTNAHVVIEEAPLTESAPVTTSFAQILPFSARSAEALERCRNDLAAHFEGFDDGCLADAAWTLQTGRREFGYRGYVIASDAKGARHALESFRCDRVKDVSGRTPPVVFLFSGQGSQHARMTAGLWTHDPVFRYWLNQCADLLPGAGLGRDLRALLYPSSADPADLERTQFAQPALFATEYALARLWEHRGVRPAAMIGHSVGELVVACLCGALDLQSALAVVIARGECMQSAAPGAMLAVPLSRAELERRLPAGLEIAAVNAPDRCVVSGSIGNIENLAAQLSKSGVHSQRLPVSHAFHSASMDPVCDQFRSVMRSAGLRKPASLWISNLTGDWIDPDLAVDPDYYVRHLRSTVQFGASVSRAAELYKDAVFLEVGPGQTLTQLARRCVSAPESCISTCPLPGTDDDFRSAQEAAGKLWSRGVKVDWAAFAEPGRKRVSLPGYSFERKRFWIDARTAAGNEKKSDVSSWFYAPSWKRTSVKPTPARSRRNWLLFLDDSDLSARLTQVLNADAATVTVRAGTAWHRAGARSYVVRPGNEVDLEMLISEIVAAGELPSSIAHLWCLQEKLGFEGALERGFYTLAFLTKAIARHRQSDIHLAVVSNGLHDVTGEEDIDPAKATLLGALRSIPQEYPGFTVCNLDGPVAQSQDAIEQLAADLCSQHQSGIVCTRGSYRWRPIYEPLTLPPSPSLLRDRGVYLITGGLGNLGLILSQFLAQAVNARLILTGRSSVPDRNQRDKLQELQALGATVETVCADVSDAAAMGHAVSRAEKLFGPIDGVFHVAGVSAARCVVPLSELTREACEEQFAVKAEGVRVLEEVFRHRNPAFFVLFSSLSTVLGGVGFAAYAAANHFLDVTARRNSRNAKCAWRSLSLDGWGEKNDGGDFITPAEGMKLFQTILNGPPLSNIVVSVKDLPTRLEKWVDRPALRQHPQPFAGQADPDSSKDGVTGLWCETLGMKQIDPADNFFRLHGDSLQATQLVARINDELGVRLSLRDFFENPTIAAIRAKLDSGEIAARITIPAAPRASHYPLTPNQRRLWIACQDAQASLAYNMSYAVRLRGVADLEALRLAFETIVGRHEVLRTAFITVMSEPRQRVEPLARFDLPVWDLRFSRNLNDQLNAELHREASTAFALDKAPLLRARLLLTADDESVLMVTVHHLVCDGLSLNAMIRELDLCYTAFCEGNKPVLPALPIQFKDFAVWQTERLRGGRLNELRAYWTEKLDEARPLELPCDGTGDSAASAARAIARLEPELTGNLRAHCAERGATLFALLTATVKVLLHEITGQAEVVVGAPMAGRDQPELAGQVGYYLNNVLLRDTVRRKESFSSLLSRVQQTVTEALAHQDYPLDLLADLIDAQVVSGHLRLFNVQVNLMPSLQADFRLGDLEMSGMDGHAAPALFDLNFMFSEVHSGLGLELAYEASRFGPTTVERMAAQTVAILRSVALEPDRPVRELCSLVRECDAAIDGKSLAASAQPAGQI